jgi:hypothetical protein
MFLPSILFMFFELFPTTDTVVELSATAFTDTYGHNHRDFSSSRQALPPFPRGEGW